VAYKINRTTKTTNSKGQYTTKYTKIRLIIIIIIIIIYWDDSVFLFAPEACHKNFFLITIK
jgi:hypothetical protein